MSSTPDDDRLLELIDEVLDESEPLPHDTALAAIDGAFLLGRADLPLASIVGDSRTEVPEVAMRSNDAQPATVVCAVGDLGIEIELLTDGVTMNGQVLPPGEAKVAIQTREMTLDVPVDDLGRFTTEIVGRFFRVSVVRTSDGLFTPWLWF